jgi:YidC/Oxa1 family membrane protein insertase
MPPLILANIFQPLIDVFDAVIRFFHDTVGLGWGLSIIALTVVVRTALIPLTVKQSKSMAAMQRLAPQIKELQAKYKDDKQRLNQEMMKFYQENKVNPFGSCLPLLLQMPVFLALFYMLRKDLKLDICGDALKAHGITHGHALLTTGCEKVAAGSAKFLFIDDLTSKATGGVLIVLILLYVGSQMGSSLLMSASADRSQRLLFLLMPLIFVTFIVNFPAGLIVYWITTNLWTVGQQYLIRRYVTHHPNALAAQAGAAALTTRKAPARASTPPKSPSDGDRADGSRTAPPPPPRKKKKRSGRRR